MIAVDLFIDTNILIYAHNRDVGEKHDKASQESYVPCADCVGHWRRYDVSSMINGTQYTYGNCVTMV